MHHQVSFLLLQNIKQGRTFRSSSLKERKLMLRSYDHIVNILTPIFLLFVIQLNSSLELVLYLALVPQDLSKEIS